MADKARLIEWDYEHGIATEYERLGECNGCGACCMTLIRWWNYRHGFNCQNPILGWHPGNGELFPDDEAKVVTEIRIGEKRRFFNNIEITGEPERCSQLTDDNKCKKHIGKHLLSREWPMSPRQVEPFENCSYHFRVVNKWSFDPKEAKEP